MKTFKRICIEDRTIEDSDGATFTLNRGNEYITSRVKSNGDVTVYSTYWVDLPVDLFAGAVPGPGEPHDTKEPRHDR